MNDSDERVLTAVLVLMFWGACEVISMCIPVTLDRIMYSFGDTPGYGPVGILESVAWWHVCVKLYFVWGWIIGLLPAYALIQAAPKGAFDFMFNRGKNRNA